MCGPVPLLPLHTFMAWTGTTLPLSYKAHIGQTCRSLTARYHEHTRYVKNNNPQTAYALHILQNLHEYGAINDTVT
jgi:hypothetical protein